MDANREAGFDPVRMAREGRFQVNDIGVICILQRASRDLAELARRLGGDPLAEEMDAHVARTHAAVQALWSSRWQQPVSRDVLTGALLDEPTSAGLLAAYAGFSGDISAAVRDSLAQTRHGVASTRRASPAYDAPRYWRGPVWQHINLLIACGLREQCHTDLYERIREDSARLFEQAGFHEYFHPETGSGLGGKDFSWTAATYLHWIAADAV
jgi:glycogen debranching enzyme